MRNKAYRRTSSRLSPAIRKNSELARLLEALTATPRDQEKKPPSRLSTLLDWLSGHWALVAVLLSGATLILAWGFGASPLHPVLQIIKEQEEWRRQQEKMELTRTMADRVYNIGQEFLNEGLYVAAQGEFKEVLKLDPTNVQAQLGLLKSEVFNLFQGEYNPVIIDKRLRVIEKVLESENRQPSTKREDPHVLVFKGDLQFILGEHQEAQKYYETAIACDPQVSQAYFKLGWVYEQNGELEEAVKMYQAAADRSRLNRDYLNNLASAYGKTGRYAEAMATYQQLHRVDPQFILPYLEMGLDLRSWGKTEKSLQMFKQTIALLENQQSASLERNQAAWAFNSKQGQVYLNDLSEKQRYAYLSAAATSYLLGQNAEAKNLLQKVRQLQGKTTPSIVALVNSDLDRMAEPREQVNLFMDLVRQEIPLAE